MLKQIKSRLSDMNTIKKLCLGAEKHALADQQKAPAAEHFLLAALDLPDDTAQKCFERFGADSATLRLAIARQYDDALSSIGLERRTAEPGKDEPLAGEPGLYNAAPSGQEVMQTLAANRHEHGPLLGAHVVAVAANMQHGVVARALRVMGIDAKALRAYAIEISNSVIDRHQ